MLTLDIMEKLASVNEKTPVSITNTECILDLNGGDNTVGWNETFTFTMPEFKAEFKWVNSEKLEAAANGKTFPFSPATPYGIFTFVTLTATENARSAPV